MKTIGLSMIVKDEAHVILRCLASVRMLIDYALIVDTGSTDGTQELIREYFREANLPGLVIDEPWQNFAYNRTFALDELRKISWIDYALVIDADDQFVFKDEFDVKRFKEAIEYDIYDVEISHGDVSYCRPQICRNALPFRYRGVLHEYLESPSGDLTRGRAEDFYVKFNGGGARSQNPHKYQEDAALLEGALSTETDPFLVSRYIFYLAQSYRDSGNREKALEFYLRRADLGFWSEEIYVSLLEAGNLMAEFGRPFEEVVAAYLRASDTVPIRAEALHAASRYCREHGRNAEGYEIARRGLHLALPKDTLFAEPWVYDYGLLDEFAVNAYWAGAYRESLDACLRLLERGCLPQSMYARMAANARFAAEKLRPPPDLGSLGEDGFVEQHALAPKRHLHSRVAGAPRVLLAILAKQKEADLPLYLECIEGLDYPKSSLVLYIRTNNNTDRTEQILREWVARVGHLYAGVEFDATDVATPVEEFREHEWNAVRFHVLGHIRNRSLQRALDLGCEFYFVVDVDNFVRRATLRELIALNLPIVAPLLRPVIPEKFYSNYHAEIDQAGYYKECDQYLWILSRHVRGLIEVPVVHCTYLIRTDVIPELTYEDGTERHEYVIFSDSARKASIPQYLDNRQIYGYLSFTEGDLHVSDGLERARALLRNDVSQNEQRPEVFRKPRGVCHVPGEILSLKEVIELWVEGEVLSPRFMDWYPGSLAQRIRQGASRLELSCSERKKLRKMNARGPFLSRYYKDIKLFQLTRWSVDRLAELRCMPEMDPTKSGRLTTLREYALSPATTRSRDPRLAASKIPAGEPHVADRPILVGFDPENRCEVLLDGYFRGILFLRSAQPSDTLPVLVPLQRPDVAEDDGFREKMSRADWTDAPLKARFALRPAEPEEKRTFALPNLTSRRRRILVFCTAFAESQERWDRRYRRWLRAIQESHLEHDSILLVDDGSPVLPDWSGLDIRPADLRDVGAFDKPVLSHFSERLGRSAVFDFPGWYRSFAYAGQFAARYGFEKIVHVESDSFLIGRRIHQYVNNAPAGWTALWCPRHGIPEAAIQIMVDDAVQRFAAIPDTHPHHRLLGQEFELQLPFDFVERGFVGDRYGEYLSFIPGNAEYAVQVQDDLPESACWWLTPIADAHPYTNGQDARSGDISKYRSCRPSITSAQYGL